MIPKAQLHLSGLVMVPVLLAVALYALAVLTGNMWFTLLAGGAVGLVVGARIWSPKLDGLELCYSGPRRAAVGEQVVHTLHVHNRSDRPTPALCIAEHLLGLAITRVYVEPLPAGGRAVAELSRVALSRGITFNGRISVVAQGGLGLVVAHANVDHGHRLVIHPRAVRMSLATSRARSRRPGGRRARTRHRCRGCPGVEVGGRREQCALAQHRTPGDPGRPRARGHGLPPRRGRARVQQRRPRLGGRDRCGGRGVPGGPAGR